MLTALIAMVEGEVEDDKLLQARQGSAQIPKPRENHLVAHIRVCGLGVVPRMTAVMFLLQGCETIWKWKVFRRFDGTSVQWHCRHLYMT